MEPAQPLRAAGVQNVADDGSSAAMLPGAAGDGSDCGSGVLTVRPGALATGTTDGGVVGIVLCRPDVLEDIPGSSG